MKKIFSRTLALVIFLFFASVNTTFAQGEPEVVAGEPMIDQIKAVYDYQVTNQVFEAKVMTILEEVIEPYDESTSVIFQTVELEGVTTSHKGEVIQVEHTRSLSQGQRKLQVGDLVLVNMSTDTFGDSTYYVIDYVRKNALFNVFLLFVLLVLLIGGMNGVTSLVGLASSFVIIFAIILPGIQLGYDPIVVAIGGAVLIIGVTFYLSHGFSEKTHWAVLGTIVSLVVTGLLATFFIDHARLTGFGSEEASFLQFLKSGELNIQGLLLAGIIIATLGVLDDITISQASIVKELKETDKRLKPEQLFFKAMNVGRDHIASLVNTLILVYAGSSLPLLLMFTSDSSRTVADVINYEIVAEEIVRTLVGSIGLVIAVPITTALAAWFGFKTISSAKKSKSSNYHHH